MKKNILKRGKGAFKPKPPLTEHELRAKIAKGKKGDRVPLLIAGFVISVLVIVFFLGWRGG